MKIRTPRCREGLRAVAVLTLVVSMLLGGGVGAQTDPASLKAIFLYRFASFVSWPPAAENGPIVLCVMGPEGFRHTLESVVRGQSVGDRPFTVRAVDGAAPGCAILYLGADEDSDRRALRDLGDAPVLTVTDGDVTSDTRGIVHFVEIADRVRFHIDDARAAESHLVIDPRLLALAVTVRRRGAR